jgi:hypothetical protein
MPTQAQTTFVPRAFAALPDAITAAVFLTAWIAPALLGPETVKDLMLTMLIEFIVMHSSGFYAVISGLDGARRSSRLLMLSGLTCFYLLFVLAFSYGFGSTWPILAFAWLFVSRFAHIWIHPLQPAGETGRMMLMWAASGAAYVVGAFATVMLPLPPFGVTPDFVAAMHLSGSGEWISRPYTVLAFGAFYFAVQAWLKYALACASADWLTGATGRAAAAPGAMAASLREQADAERHNDHA